jgi:hypothetical protein
VGFVPKKAIAAHSFNVFHKERVVDNNQFGANLCMVSMATLENIVIFGPTIDEQSFPFFEGVNKVLKRGSYFTILSVVTEVPGPIAAPYGTAGVPLGLPNSISSWLEISLEANTIQFSDFKANVARFFHFASI